MKRRQFIKKGAATGSLLSFGGAAMAAEAFRNPEYIIDKQSFNLKYASHEGMFKAHAGDSIIDQLEFMADRGFTAFEDNEMKNRPLYIVKKHIGFNEDGPVMSRSPLIK